CSGVSVPMSYVPWRSGLPSGIRGMPPAAAGFFAGAAWPARSGDPMNSPAATTAAARASVTTRARMLRPRFPLNFTRFMPLADPYSTPAAPLSCLRVFPVFRVFRAFVISCLSCCVFCVFRVFRALQLLDADVLLTVDGHGLLGALVDVQLKDIRPRVVPDDVEVELAADDLRRIDVGHENRLVFGVRPGEEVAERIDDAAAAARDDRLRVVAEARAVVGGEVAAAVELIARQHEAASFDGDVPHRGDPGVARICRRRAVQLYPLRVHRRAHQRQVVLPADHRAEPSERRVEHRQGGAVAESPDETLRRGRHHLAMFADGAYLGKHRKVMPTASERLVWGFGDGSTLPVFDTPLGRLGAVICWENYLPLMRAAMYSKGIELYCAPTADPRDSWVASTRHIAVEGRCFVLSCNQFNRRRDFPADYRTRFGDDPETIVTRGGSCIVDPFGNFLAGPNTEDEAILVADIDPAQIIRGKFDLDVVGHYARPDIFQLHVDERPKQPVTLHRDVAVAAAEEM